MGGMKVKLAPEESEERDSVYYHDSCSSSEPCQCD